VVLKTDLAALDDLGRQIAGRRARIQLVAASLDAGRQKIAALLRRKAELQRQTAAQAAEADARSAKLAAEAKDVRELIEKLARQRQQEEEEQRRRQEELRQQEQLQQQQQEQQQKQQQKQQGQAKRPVSPGNIRAFPKALGSLAAPVAGRLVARFGATDESGSPSKGILLETRPQAAVVAPFDGQVLFRGPFRSYGEILIIQHAGGYHSLLAGLARSDATVGQWVLAGEPVGVMGLSENGGPKLYMELRRDGHPVDPAPWLGKTDSKVE
jgi:septal ring factor EnvC (AmiA/AmiB activator)